MLKHIFEADEARFIGFKFEVLDSQSYESLNGSYRIHVQQIIAGCLFWTGIWLFFDLLNASFRCIPRCSRWFTIAPWSRMSWIISRARRVWKCSNRWGRRVGEGKTHRKNDGTPEMTPCRWGIPADFPTSPLLHQSIASRRFCMATPCFLLPWSWSTQ